MAAKKIIKTTLKDAALRAVRWLLIGRAVLFLGGSGMGKSAVFRDVVCTELAKFHEGYDKLPILLDLRLSYRESVDLRGVPKVNEEKGTTEWFAPAEWPTEGPGVIFIDEITQAEKSVQHACYQLILERKLAEYTVPDDVYIVAAGNRETDGCGLRKLDAALRQRFAVIEPEPSAAGWREDFAIPNEVREELIVATYIFPELVEGWDGSVNAQQSTARELTALSDVLKTGVPNDEVMGFALDVLGEAAALKVAPFVTKYEGIIPLSSIFKDPNAARTPDYDEFDTAISVTLALAKESKPKDVENALIYIDRLDSQFRALFAKSFPILASEKSVRAKAWEDWTVTNKNLTLN